jgi:hypothetical protein
LAFARLLTFGGLVPLSRGKENERENENESSLLAWDRECSVVPGV